MFQKPLSQELGMDKPSIFETVRAFEATLIELGVLIVPHCDKLINPRYKSLLPSFHFLLTSFLNLFRIESEVLHERTLQR
jgi:hypothetical protein